eukprot:2374006-Amphidinium_carterae.1
MPPELDPLIRKHEADNSVRFQDTQEVNLRSAVDAFDEHCAGNSSGGAVLQMVLLAYRTLRWCCYSVLIDCPAMQAAAASQQRSVGNVAEVHQFYNLIDSAS